MIVDHNRQVIRGEAVLFENDLVVGHRRVGFATDQVIERQRHIVVGHSHTHHRGRVEAGRLGALVARLAQAQAVVARRLFARGLLGAHLLESLRSAPAIVGITLGQEPLGCLLIERQPL